MHILWAALYNIHMVSCHSDFMRKMLYETGPKVWFQSRGLIFAYDIFHWGGKTGLRASFFLKINSYTYDMKSNISKILSVDMNDVMWSVKTHSISLIKLIPNYQLWLFLDDLEINLFKILKKIFVITYCLERFRVIFDIKQLMDFIERLFFFLRWYCVVHNHVFAVYIGCCVLGCGLYISIT